MIVNMIIHNQIGDYKDVDNNGQERYEDHKDKSLTSFTRKRLSTRLNA